MNHQPFRDWLVAEEPLSTDQTIALQEHLQACNSCQQIARSWKDLELVMRQSSQVAPPEGFVLRLSSRIQRQQMHHRVVRNWAFAGVIGLAAGLFLLLLVTQILSIIQSPATYLTTWLNFLVQLVSYVFMVASIIESIEISRPLYTLLGMFFLFGIVSFLSVLWLATYRRLSMPVRQS